MRRFAATLTAVLSGCATTSSGWPGEADARNYFFAQRETLLRIAERFDAEPDLRHIAPASAGTVRVGRGERYSWPVPPTEDKELASLINNTRIESVRRDDDIVDFGLSFWFAPSSGPPIFGRREIEYRLSYLRVHPGASSPYVQCPSEPPRPYRGSFGHCSMPLAEPSWFIHYFWASK